MLQFRHPGAAPSLDEVRAAFELDPGDVDLAYGVVGTDPAAGLYVVLVDARAEPKVRAALAARPRDPAEGLFGDARVEPLGP